MTINEDNKNIAIFLLFRLPLVQPTVSNALRFTKHCGKIELNLMRPRLKSGFVQPTVSNALRFTKHCCTKNGKLPTSHCYDHIPLLCSHPGGLNRS